MKYTNIREEELKNRVAQDFFEKFDATGIINDIDFSVKLKRSANAIHFNDEYLLWAEAKNAPTDILVMLTQLVLTIGKARIFDKILPPPFLGCFDCEKIAFVPYADIQEIFYQNDFNWKVAPSNHETREFKQVKAHIEKALNCGAAYSPPFLKEGCRDSGGVVKETDGVVYIFNFEKDEKELKQFIHKNFIVGKTETSKIRIDKNNFIIIYNKWLEVVKPTIQVDDWDLAKKKGIIDGDFYLADLLSAGNKTLKEKLFVLLKTDHYELDRKLDESGFKNFKTTAFSDNQKAHNQFWAKYERPPLEEYWDYIVERRDLLVPQDVRERKGSFFTPKIWVELSQKYIADVLGEDWQDEYYVWDCAAGTGNLLAGLTNKYNIWASTLDQADVEVMKDRIHNGANLLETHVFQFDFLNDDFTKLPQGLQDIINDEGKRKKLVIYINPPYAEAASKENVLGTGKNKTDVAVVTKVYEQYLNEIGIAGRELSAQFLARINREISNSILAQFSKLKIVQGPNFSKFRNFFKVEFQKGFVVPANTFDNVKGVFPIGFMIWKLNGKKKLEDIHLDLYNKSSEKIGQKTFFSYDESSFITDWFRKYHTRIKSLKNIGSIGLYGSDFQHNNYIRITSCEEHPNRWTFITAENIIELSIYFAVRQVIPADWLNDRDQFLYPNDGWQTDEEFQNNCLTYTLFNNNIQSKYGTNHWIPFTEAEINARDKFDSNFMTDFMKGKITKTGITNPQLDVFSNVGANYVQSEMELPIAAEPEFEHNVGTKSFSSQQTTRKFSSDAQNVFNAGRELWRYYHAQQFPSFFKGGVDAAGGRGGYNVNASLYDIREYFQGRNDKGKMNNKSDNETYNELIGNLRAALKVLAKKIEPKVFGYGFLRE
jgi:hypothetical protein